MDEVLISGLKRENFQAVIQGKETDLYTLKNSDGMEVCITNYGGALVAIMVPDKEGKMANVIQGHDSIQHLMDSPEPFLSTLVGRFIPVIRQLISIPAGLSKMNLGAFCFFTTIGALAWNVILALLGYLAYKAADPSVIEKYSHQLSIIIVALFVAVMLFFVLRAVIRKRKRE